MSTHTDRSCIHLGVGSDEVLADTSASLLFTLEDIIGPCASRAQDRTQDRDHDSIRSAVLKAFAIAHLGDALARSRARSDQETRRVDDGCGKCDAEERSARSDGRRSDKGKTPIRVRPLPPTPSGSFTLPSGSFAPSMQQRMEEPRSAPPSRQGSQRRALPRLPIGPRPASSPSSSSYAASSSAPSTSYARSGPRLAGAGKAGFF
ncbi:uncharacterized protein SCHCODRAFT_02624054 [Schizophyllum commune H4-8]|uniref:uncharacterized protein n=1 Tax=Schizophyllum commune (strain H4-8 / FGSC 9210) TaxID=578458 RepID=UPI00215FF955|nr:uncharacterized protein SCHCODRAFT_02624054 [Schizophyllum commune H4-8]KAI5894217.1 hypothetical protein SCHCODRAFT_02624054 [Schizophyllum commune H4-8]